MSFVNKKRWLDFAMNKTRFKVCRLVVCRIILNIRWPEVVSNEELWNKAKQTLIDMEIKKRKLGWIGQTLREPVPNIIRQALE